MIAFDTNVLVYAEDPNDPGGRHALAAALLTRLALSDAIIPVQVLGEFVNVCRKKALASHIEATRKVGNYAAIFYCPATEVEDLGAAALLADRFQLQFFDALIAVVAGRVGATVLLSEDMQDGIELDGLKVLNPFNPMNGPEIERILLEG